MAQLLGRTIGDRYRVEQELGSGGMATVYVALDLRHDRQVAVKVLRPELSAIVGAERFLNEIRTTANLQHPHILPLLDSGEVNGLIFYVMPLVKGESLRDRLNRDTQLPIEDAVRIAHDAGEALDYAHRQGVIHRDIKPENILLHDGRALVADFGIALAVRTAGGDTRLTETGISLGTPHYMSPEQAMGERDITARSDVYSLGCVLYEMLAGEPPFTGPTAQAIVAKMVTSDPADITTLRKTVPVHVAAAVHIALQRLPADRFSSAHDFNDALTGQRALRLQEVPRRRGIAVSTRWQTLLPWGLLSASLVVAAIGWTRRPEAAPVVPITRFVVADSTLHRSVAGRNVTLSPDGSKLIYRRGLGDRAVFVLRDLTSLEESVIDLPGQFSPDGLSMVFTGNGTIRTRRLAGGAAVDLVPGDRPSWGDAGRIVFEREGALFTVNADGSDARPLTTVDFSRGERRHQWAHFLPGGEAVVFSIVDSVVANDELAVVRLDEGRVTRLGVRGTSPQFVSSGFLVFGRHDGTGGAVPFDAKRLEVTGPEVNALDRVIVRSGGAVEFSVARNGTIAYIEGSNQQQLVLVDHEGVPRTLSEVRAGYSRPQMSTDGSRILVTVSSDLWVLDVASKSERRLTTDRRSNNAWWMDGGRSILWQRADSNRFEIRKQPLDGSVPARTLYAVPTSEGRFGAIVPDPLRQWLLAVRSAGTGNMDLLIAHLDTVPLVFRPILSSSASEHSPAVSPDGRRMAYSSNETGRNEVYVTNFPKPAATIRVSTGGGDNAAWSPDNRTLFYRGGNRMIAIRFDASGTGFTTDSLFSLDRYPQVPGPPSSTSSMTPDGKYFLMAVADQSRRLVVALSFADELQRRFTELQRER